jgi:hypothetical protein
MAMHMRAPFFVHRRAMQPVTVRSVSSDVVSDGFAPREDQLSTTASAAGFHNGQLDLQVRVPCLWINCAINGALA